MRTSEILHESLPQTYTKERLADWIKSNKVDTHIHVEEFPLTEAEIQGFESMSSKASRAIDRLKAIEKMIKETLKKGTPFNHDKGENGEHEPVSYTIPPTKGLDTLTANREYADRCIERGVRDESTTIYMIPYPEQSKIIGVDIEGYEWAKFSRVMTKDEINQYKPLLKVDKESRKVAMQLDRAGVTVTGYDEKTGTLHVKGGKRTEDLDL